MLIKIAKYHDLDTRKLMDIYAESNFENTNYFYPDELDKDIAVQKVETGFLNFLKNEFFNNTHAYYWVLEENGVWLCALRTYMIGEGIYYLEALETRPDSRRKGYAVGLLNDIIESLKKGGPFRLCSCVSKKNTASLKTHLKSGFKIVSEEGYDYLSGESDNRDYGLEYNYQ